MSFQLLGDVPQPIAIVLAFRGDDRIGLLFIVFVIGLFWVANHFRIKAIRMWRERKRARERCMHGVIGAAQKGSLCTICNQEAEERSRLERDAWIAVAAKRDADRAAKYRRWIAQIRVPEYLKSMDPEEFEKLCCRLFEKLGYRVEPTRYVGDNGADGFLFQDGVKTVLQCKRFKGAVGEPILRDLYGTMHATGSNQAVVVTTGTVSKQAQVWLGNKPIRIIELDELGQLIRTHFDENELVPHDFQVQVRKRDDGRTCPICGKALRIIKGRHGPFFGCTGYPDCRFTRPKR